MAVVIETANVMLCHIFQQFFSLNLTPNGKDAAVAATVTSAKSAFFLLILFFPFRFLSGFCILVYRLIHISRLSVSSLVKWCKVDKPEKFA